MASTSLKLSDELKTRIAPLAQSAGITPHAWMVSALRQQTLYAEQRNAFLHDALLAENEVREHGEVYRAEDVHNYLRSKLEGRDVQAPQPVKV